MSRDQKGSFVGLLEKRNRVNVELIRAKANPKQDRKEIDALMNLLRIITHRIRIFKTKFEEMAV